MAALSLQHSATRIFREMSIVVRTDRDYRCEP